MFMRFPITNFFYLEGVRILSFWKNAGKFLVAILRWFFVIFLYDILSCLRIWSRNALYSVYTKYYAYLVLPNYILFLDKIVILLSYNCVYPNPILFYMQYFGAFSA